MATASGREILLDLPKAVAMADGDGLQLETGAWVRVRAAPEPVVQIEHADPLQLIRIAWHLGLAAAGPDEDAGTAEPAQDDLGLGRGDHELSRERGEKEDQGGKDSKQF